MCDDVPGAARLDSAGHHVEAIFELWLEQPREVVWLALTKPARLADWLAPEGGEGPRRPDGLAIDSRVTRCQPQWLLEYAWSGPGGPERLIRWELFETPMGAKLALTVRVRRDEDTARALAGWAAQMTMLAAELAGEPAGFPLAQFEADREAYRMQLAAA